jgi:NAD(P)-dependent dehydrogenase (short-subunit alcohol dehydrogenase family)
MSGELAGQVAVVTGGGRGIGRGIAEALAAAGAAVTVTARSPHELAETVALIERAGGQALAHPADVTDEPAMHAAVQATEAHFGPVTLLVNNAGIAGPIEPLWETDLDAWWHCLAVHLKGAAIGAKAVLPGMIARRQGRIINISSAVASRAFPYLTAYSIAKAALLRLTESLTLETREYGLSAFALDPGGVRTSAIDDHLLVSPWTPRAFPFLQQIDREEWGARWTVPVTAPANRCVRLATGAADALSGRLIRVHDDLDALIAGAEAIKQDDLYALRLRT